MQNAELQARLGWYEEQFRLGQQRRYGASSERTSPEQLSLVFNEVEATAEPTEPTEETITYKRRKRRGSRNETLENLPVKVVEHRLDESEQICPCCMNLYMR